MYPSTPVRTDTGKRGVVIYAVPLTFFFVRLGRRERPYNALLQQVRQENWEIANAGWVAAGGALNDLAHCVCLTKGENPCLLVVVYPTNGRCPHGVHLDVQCAYCQRCPYDYRWWSMKPHAEVIEVLKE